MGLLPKECFSPWLGLFQTVIETKFSMSSTTYITVLSTTFNRKYIQLISCLIAEYKKNNKNKNCFNNLKIWFKNFLRIVFIKPINFHLKNFMPSVQLFIWATVYLCNKNEIDILAINEYHIFFIEILNLLTQAHPFFIIFTFLSYQ